ncbi:MAG: riboflavin synthase [candidate division Zixibacteria bacterium]|nr:riboflavin synthase [candidate division Zixibacteria bacterium]MDD5425363.1 riboflavin synthase [candidate division Zixibacteria bacterium]
MFTGLIETTGIIREIKYRGNYSILRVASTLPAGELKLGESIACDGACLTVVDINKDCFTVEASQETVSRTILDRYKVGTRINIERALKAGDRMGGHFVSGHIDDTGVVDYLKPLGESWELAVNFSPEYDIYVVEKGSIALNGLSLTVNRCRPGWLTVNLIPHTVNVTTVGGLRTGDRINMEFDLIGKYIARFISRGKKNGVTKDLLKESGW